IPMVDKELLPVSLKCKCRPIMVHRHRIIHGKKQKMHKIMIGTRASELALVQANYVKTLLETGSPGVKAELVKITTTGDRVQDRNLTDIGGKGLFIKEIEEHMLEGKID